MGCRINLSSTPATLYKNPSKPHHSPCRLSPIKPQPRTIAIASYSSTGSQESTSSAPTSGACSVNFQSLKDCKLGISRYPDFNYNAEGGKATATGRVNETSISGDVVVSFEVGTLYIPPLMSATTRFLGLPLPPFLRIDIVPEFLSGIINRETGKVDLEFKAKFWFSVGKIYRAPPLIVVTKLTSEESKGEIRGGKGGRLDGEGRCRLVGVAKVDPIGDLLMDSFLGLPTECLAVINARLLICDVI